jgi:hypothetical protein
MPMNPSWSTEMDRIAKESEGNVTEDDEKYIRELIKIPNDEISIEDVAFKSHQNYF